MTDVAAIEGGRGGLTRGEANRAMRGFISASGVWGMWGQTVGIGTAVFVVGGVNLVGGAALFISGLEGDADARATPRVGLHSTGLSLEASW